MIGSRSSASGSETRRHGEGSSASSPTPWSSGSRGWTTPAALEREARVPTRAIRSVSTGRRVVDLPVVRDRDRVVTLELDRLVPRAAYDVVAVGVDDPDTVAAGIDAWRGEA